jgi:RNA polymerase sigma-70 factor (ECF subfamily)
MKENEIEQLFRQHYAQMAKLARTMLYDDEEARDVVSEVFAALIRSDIVPVNIKNYLLTSVRNRCLSILEHKSVRAKFEQAYTLEMKSASQAAEEGGGEYQSNDRLGNLMTYAEQNLTKQALRVFRMRHLQGMKYQDIADELGISRVMVYKHLTQAMEKIKEYQHKIR